MQLAAIRHKLKPFALAVIGLAILFLFLVNPTGVSWFPQCPFHRLTGFDCPGCGSSRGMHSLMHGHFLEAANYNVLLFMALPMLTAGFYYKLTGRGARVWQWMNRPFIILIIVCGFWLIRNIPVYPFYWLNSGH